MILFKISRLLFYLILSCSFIMACSLSLIYFNHPNSQSLSDSSVFTLLLCSWLCLLTLHLVISFLIWFVTFVSIFIRDFFF